MSNQRKHDQFPLILLVIEKEILFPIQNRKKKKNEKQINFL
jgi:hypothetical protein